MKTNQTDPQFGFYFIIMNCVNRYIISFSFVTSLLYKHKKRH